ncbi:uncharacterized protein F5147DRAFT_661565 [Suillus discolor]|uniref:CxC2-like cysteine cluster KDZ transposase-associated domain-containing protein n=1 Tax=Suillus discolor TaxID=1912936 RepID=A0A9P7EQS1_9AGAM|nr:uncharacterized protein F5147DRAFT_661565 [Suillus discolor]KAG2079945.1 hypothetical protein F5147DRAFT_661565 [Suillus discolor]
MVIWLGHKENACPWDDDVGKSALFTTGEGDSDDTDAKSTLNEPNAEQSMKEAHDLPTGMPFIRNNKAMTTIVDKSGVHTYIIKYCTCPEAATTDIQLFHMVQDFGNELLQQVKEDDHEHLSSLGASELCGASSAISLIAMKDHYQELMRVARQWRKLKLLKWNGFGHEKKEVRPGDLALFFSDALYKEHLAIAKDAVQCSECNNHRTVNLANASRHRLEATGIGGCACVRHECFVLHAMVDFQKGERQMNMDCALCEELKLNAKGICHILTFYDVNSPTRKQQELRLLMVQGWWPDEAHQKGAATWLAEGLAIEEAQVMLQMDDIDRWMAAGAIILSEELGDNDMQIMQPDLLILQEEAEEDIDIELRVLSRKRGNSRSGKGRLGADDALLKRYQPLTREHLKVSTAVADPNSRGQRDNVLAWFWSLDVEGDSDSSDWLNEFYHVHWLHAKAMRD